jgi:hypothetical protein
MRAAETMGCRARSARTFAGCAETTVACVRSGRSWQKPRPGSLGDRFGEVFEFIRANQATFRVATRARVLGISPSGYHAWRKRATSARSQSDEALRTRIRAIHERSRGN